MRHCDGCGVDVATPQNICPLCGAPLTGQGGEAVYPAFGTRRGYHFVKRLLVFLSLVAVFVCALVNWLTQPDFWWWLIVATALCYAWTVVPHAMRRGGNGGGKILVQVVGASAFVLLLDMETGWRGWALDYVLPFIFCAGITAVMILILCRRTSWAGYVLYQVLLAGLGFLPLALYAAGLARSVVAAGVPALLALASLAALAVFGDRTIKNEFRRRLHF